MDNKVIRSLFKTALDELLLQVSENREFMDNNLVERILSEVKGFKIEIELEEPDFKYIDLKAAVLSHLGDKIKVAVNG